ncbi:MAG: class I SAM-dependent methyltransferase [bacterium]|nr:class I SAM-dependent methyltransferase [bacterium]
MALTDGARTPGAAAPANLATGKPSDAGQFILERRERLVKPLLPTCADHLVDFGCGNGAQTLCFLDRFREITGLDIMRAELDGFAAACRRLDVEDRVRGVLADDGPLPLPDACADVVTSFTVLEHVADERAVLREMRRVLKPGGLLVVTVPNRWWLFETHGADLPLLPWNRVPFVSWWPKRLHDRWARARIYRRGEIEALLRECGFEPTATMRLTAPMDVLPAKWLRTLARATLFRADRTRLPFLATEILVAARPIR